MRLVICAGILAFSVICSAQQQNEQPKKDEKAEAAALLPVPDAITENTVTIGNQKIAYRAVAGTLTVGGTDAYDQTLSLDGQSLTNTGLNPLDAKKPEDAPATARMFYVAYLKKDAVAANRPLVFLYNGGPGSSTMWLHMGAFGPRRVITEGVQHPAGAPYNIAENKDSLLDVADLVFIDAPGTGFSRVMGKDAPKAFFGVDQDAHAFERFILRFLTKYERWNSPKYLFGESYGTPRSAVISALLRNVDLNGIILLSAILSFDNSVDDPHWNPGVDQAYALALPTYAASAFYHHKLAKQPAALEPFLREVEAFALGEYETALLAGSTLSEAQRQSMAQKLHDYTGLPVEYWLKANLRVQGGEFSKTLQDPQGLTTGRLDTRYSGPPIDPLAQGAEYDPQSQAVSAAYTTAVNQYLRVDLKYGKNETYKVNAYGDGFQWDLRHHPPNGPGPGESEGGLNVMPDLATAMKLNPKMRILVSGGYYDLATPYFEGIYEMHHLQIPQHLQQNISYSYYESGHMVYVSESVLTKFHEDVAKFIKDGAGAGK